MGRRKKQNSWITLSVSVGAIVLFGLVSVLLVWISGNTGDAFSGKWDDYDVILDENCAPGALRESVIVHRWNMALYGTG